MDDDHVIQRLFAHGLHLTDVRTAIFDLQSGEDDGFALRPALTAIVTEQTGESGLRTRWCVPAADRLIRRRVRRGARGPAP